MKTLKYPILIIVTLGFVGSWAAVTPVAQHFSARPPDPNCVQRVADPNSVPFPIDPQRIVGILLPTAKARAGKFVQRFRACDPNGDAFDLTLEQAPAGFSLMIDDANGIATVSGELPRGVSYFYFRATDTPGAVADPCEVLFTFAVQGTGRPNKPPVLWPF